MRLTSFLQDGTLTIELTGELDHHRAKDYIQAIHTKLEAYTPRVCVLDFRNITFMDSSGIAVVINTLRCITKTEGKLYIKNIGLQPMRVFQTSGIDKLVEIMEDKNEV